MSTNKRKESAALFELLDKSTLKVPKSGGSLKIPSWWSSKTNPAPVAPPPPADIPEMPAAAQRTAGAANGSAVPINDTQPSPQHKLFDPPPADAPAAVSPSIRPPAVTPPVNPPVSAARAASRPIEPAPRGGGAVIIDAPNEPEPPRPIPTTTPDSARRIFAPQTYDPHAAARRNWMGSQKRLMARTSPWAVLTACSAVLALLILIVWLIVRHHQQTTAHPDTGMDLRGADSSFVQERGSSQPLVAPQPGHGGSLLPPPQPRTPILQQNTPNETPNAPDTANEIPETPGKVYAPGTVERDAKLLYIIIASTPQDDVAKRNADFLAKNGIDVSIETLKSPRGRSTMYTLISVKGFPTLNEAENYRKRIVQIGHKTADFQKTRKAWDDAYATHVKSLAQQTK